MSRAPVLSAERIRDLDCRSAAEAWDQIRSTVQEIFGSGLHKDSIAETMKRDGQVAPLDLYLSTSAWDLWKAFPKVVQKNSDALKEWWNSQTQGRGILILDGFSLRELSWFVTHASNHQVGVKAVRVFGSEFPADTVPFAKALGFGQRSSLQNNGGRGNQSFPGCHTESTGAPFLDCMSMLGVNPDVIFWHHWPDDMLHYHSGHGAGLKPHLQDVAGKMLAEDFWEFLLALCQGRKVVVTSDHGYAATGNFTDVADAGQVDFLRTHFHAQRTGTGDFKKAHPWSPPLALHLSPQATEEMGVLGRRKWPVSGGYPTISHGGISLLEMLVPFIELEFGT